MRILWDPQNQLPPPDIILTHNSHATTMENQFIWHTNVETLNTALHDNMAMEEPYMVMIIKINFVDGSNGWWFDINASNHVGYDCAMLKIYTYVEDMDTLLGDFHTTKIAGIGDEEQ